MILARAAATALAFVLALYGLSLPCQSAGPAHHSSASSLIVSAGGLRQAVSDHEPLCSMSESHHAGVTGSAHDQVCSLSSHNGQSQGVTQSTMSCWGHLAFDPVPQAVWLVTVHAPEKMLVPSVLVPPLERPPVI